jgi:hypothetical protein
MEATLRTTPPGPPRDLPGVGESLQTAYGRSHFEEKHSGATVQSIICTHL